MEEASLRLLHIGELTRDDIDMLNISTFPILGKIARYRHGVNAEPSDRFSVKTPDFTEAPLRPYGIIPVA